ncbi:hypothetical protein BO86DRAFT_140436 [Aspergillus japonicus CBS 114.51]|uniref:Uncharacterized protein n=1 Tax=Aspergillus japonicus CBS 114.51 TaxID=1448312 RepID=A0A8T8XD38_ASPJA|nr:hypothetical protein BO86DRAFT_140436 [Aspergillus japonicus CBS 114.51]RAH86203.1 hypothetical protein BO86DRAFT_140436 [Aspergillus japonicus CBS 114.51]
MFVLLALCCILVDESLFLLFNLSQLDEADSNDIPGEVWGGQWPDRGLKKTDNFGMPYLHVYDFYLGAGLSRQQVKRSQLQTTPSDSYSVKASKMTATPPQQQ